MQVRARISVQQKRHSVHRIGRERLGSHDGRFDSLSKRSAEVSPLAQSGARSPISDSGMSAAESEASSRTTSTSALPLVDDTTVGIEGEDDRQPVAIPPQSPKHKLVGQQQQSLDMIEEGEEPDVAPILRRPRSLTEPGECASEYTQEIYIYAHSHNVHL